MSPGGTEFPRAVILTALRVEFLAVRAFLREITEESHPQGTIYDRGLFTDARGSIWDILLAEIGAGNAGAARETERAVNHFRPQIALFVGVAGGLKDVAIGDVVVATKVYGYEGGKDEGGFKIRPNVHETSYDLQQRARAEARRELWSKLSTEPQNFQVHVGPIASGEKVLAKRKSALSQFIRQNYGDALAVEMEAFGFLDGVHANRSVQAIVVRGISDLLSGKSRADRGGSQQRASRNASRFAFEILSKLRHVSIAPNSEPSRSVRQVDRPDQWGADGDHSVRRSIAKIIEPVALGDWTSAEAAALQIITFAGPNNLPKFFRALLTFQEDDNPDTFWSALQTWESLICLAPYLIDHGTLRQMSEHHNYSVRASAASICMELAQFSPDSVPVDLLLKLSVFSEDWYVQAPANAALKALARPIPAVLRIYFQRLRSSHPGEREHAAAALRDVAKHEPDLIDAAELTKEVALLRRDGDKRSVRILLSVLPRVRQARKKAKWKYGL